MSRGRVKFVTFVALLTALDVGLALHATLTRRTPKVVSASGRLPTTVPRVASLGEVLGWVIAFLLLVLIAVVIVDAVWMTRPRNARRQGAGPADPGEADRRRR